ncbi:MULTISPECIES: D-alanyl-D-alanine carboxypeptidase family protein [Cobetia]|jgi:D-alanyl-D-alanine carboxypeptidase (penicillin-binding protein 5/6)|uniref:D-alanyl-D-alanine carboxypeptidase family protein n=1 Tax=Cobetia TaxID=204286 RepID=UPI0009860A4C|nr:MULTISPECIES: D-alanyl-D-alanine carboxypeptidase family protein [Cobetia]MDI6003981.1 D-alanyl-D-alanine carboxypeptidase family protein [Cobetia pacifica]POR08368.1 serine-type D-Ala-D-Ala carboxypeptidase [Cobetia sp. MM1IDA2H-1]
MSLKARLLPLRRRLAGLMAASGIALLTSVTSTPAQAIEADTLIPAAPQLAASSWILMDANSGRILVEHNADKRLPPASLTKMMTAYLVENEIDDGKLTPDENVRISVNAWKTGGSRMFIREGTSVSVDDLLHGVIIQSGNDASVALAEHIGGSEGSFADLMNQHAKRLGMNNTHYMNATGLPHAEHYSTAHDLAILARHIIRDYPDHYQIYSQKYFTWNGIKQPNRNKLLWRDKDVDGLKTGHTDEAGYCLVASAKKEDTRLISVVMGTSSEEARAQESQKLLTYGFRYFESKKLYDKGAVLNQARVWGGEKDQVRLGMAKEVYLTLPSGQADKLTARLDLKDTIKAPVQVGEQYGTLQIKLEDKVLAEEPLVALESVEQGGLFKRLWDALMLFFHGLFN